jgi:hypothetical protein
MPFCQTNGLSQFLNGSELTGLYASPPSPCAADGAQAFTKVKLPRS